ncbi:fructose-bisphosphate aldolase [Arthrobacter sp. MYb224]|uniref:class II fructose-bisphosphate aldolase n=1 Tax=unclassified Arthrobacter TaxID=235627 RepID=UPI000CFB5C60|nr:MULTISPECIES: class II fructose-bisphosphate aldolase [unclassified Arthrobacter]PQZ98181.1 fructose-bisphosphate aldolase [Arthrobacter sp. MYb224]PRA02413.1 fructose-bisphosphate aldolase [Arthrobacter sp. MYb229]PRB50644.1 fructose-bisphosphate aldolase [Arthrobacter sp. MYb216]
MPLVPTREIMDLAQAGAFGQGAFNVIHLETAQALIQGAELANTALILQISENCVKYHGGLAPIAAASKALAELASVPVALHLDHAEDEQLVYQALELGFGSVMFDGAKLGFEDNVAATRRVVAAAKLTGTYVEAELGEIGGKDGAHAPGVRTDPGEAAHFSSLTGIDALAVAVGSSHAMLHRGATLDLELIGRLKESLDIPLVLHGSSGVPDETLVDGIRAGMRKINVSTHLNGYFTRAVRQWLAEHPEAVDSRKYMAAGRTQMAIEAARLLKLFASA